MKLTYAKGPTRIGRIVTIEETQPGDYLFWLTNRCYYRVTDSGQVQIRLSRGMPDGTYAADWMLDSARSYLSDNLEIVPKDQCVYDWEKDGGKQAIKEMYETDLYQ